MELQILVRDLKETNSIERIMWEQTTLDDQGKEIKSTNTEKKSPLFWGGCQKHSWYLSTSNKYLLRQLALSKSSWTLSEVCFCFSFEGGRGGFHMASLAPDSTGSLAEGSGRPLLFSGGNSVFLRVGWFSC